MPQIEAQHQQAVDVHSRQANDFAASYEAYQRDPYESCFTYSRMRLRQALDVFLPQSAPGQRALDVGCGTGHHLRDLELRGFAVAGADGSREMLEEARRTSPSADLHEADVASLPFPDGTFDLILCIEVLRYLEDSERCISEIGRVLRPGGVCLATAAPMFSLNGYALVNRAALVAPVGDLVRLKQYFTTPSQLARRFQRAGFDDVAVHGVYTGPINWIERLAPQRLPAFLNRWERIDHRLADRPALRGLSNMLLARAVRS